MYRSYTKGSLLLILGPEGIVMSSIVSGVVNQALQLHYCTSHGVCIVAINLNYKPTMMLSTQIASASRRPTALFRAGSSSVHSLSSALPSWATLDPSSLGTTPEPYAVSNIVNGTWSTSQKSMVIPNPMDKDAPPVCTIPDTQSNELGPFIASMKAVPKSGVHNPLKNNERYLQYGEISRKVRGNIHISDSS